MSLDDEIVMTPLQVETGTTVKIERVQKEDFDANTVQLFAGGPYKGIIIRKQVHEYPDTGLPDESREFVCYVNNPKLEEGDPDAVIKEKRTLRFWFVKGTPDTAKAADHYLEQILQPRGFPKSSIFYVKKLITEMRTKLGIVKMESEMRELEPGEEEWMRSTRKHVTRVSITAVLTRYPKKKADDPMNELNEDDPLHINGEVMENGYQESQPDEGKPGDRRTWPHLDDYNYEHQGGVVIEILDQEGQVVKTVEEGDVYVQPPKSPVKRKHSVESDDEDEKNKRISFFAKLRDSMRDSKRKSKSPTPEDKEREKKEKDEKRKSKLHEKERKEKEKNEKAAVLRKKKDDDKARKAQDKKEKDEKRKSKKDDDDVEEKMEIDPAVGVVLAAERPRTSESDDDKHKESENDSGKPLVAPGTDEHDPKHVRTDVVLTAHVRGTSVDSDDESPDKGRTKRKHASDGPHESEPEENKGIESENEERKGKPSKDKKRKKGRLYLLGRKSTGSSDSEEEDGVKKGKDKDEKHDKQSTPVDDKDEEKITSTTITLAASAPTSPQDDENDKSKPKDKSILREKKPKDKKDKANKRSGLFSFGRKSGIESDSENEEVAKRYEPEDDKKKDDDGMDATGDDEVTVTLEAHVPGTPHDQDDGHDSDSGKKKTKQEKKPHNKDKDKTKKKGGFFTFGRKHSADSDDEEPKKKPHKTEDEGKGDKDVPSIVVSTDDDGKEVTRTMVTLEANVPKSPSTHDDSFDGDEKKTWSLKRDKTPKEKTKESDKPKKKGVFLSFGRRSGAASDTEDDAKDKNEEKDGDHDVAAADDNNDSKEVTTTAVTLEAKSPKSPSHLDDGQDSDAEKKTWSLKRDKKPKDKSKDTEHKHKGISLNFGRKPRTKSETDDEKGKVKEDVAIPVDEAHEKEVTVTSVTLEAHAPTTPTGHDNDSDTEKKTWSLKRDKKPKDKKDTDRKKKGISLTLGRKPHDSEDEDEGKKKDDEDSTVPADEDNGKEVSKTTVTLEAHAPRTPTSPDDDNDTEKKTWSLKRDKKPKDKDEHSDRKKKGISLTLFGKKPHDDSQDDEEGKKKDVAVAVPADEDHEKEVTVTSVTLEAHSPTTPTGHDNDSDTEKKTWSLKRDKKPKDKKDTDRKKKGISLTLFGKKPHDDSQEDEEGKKKEDVVAVPADEDHEKEVTVTSVTLEAHSPTTPTGHDNDSDTEKKTWSLKRDKKPKDKKDTDRKKKGISLTFGRKPHDSDDEGKKKDDEDSTVPADEDNGKEVSKTTVTLEAHAPRTPTSPDDDNDTEKKTWSLKRDKKPKDKDEHSDRKKKGISLTLFGKKPHDDSQDDEEGKKKDVAVAVPADEDHEKEVTVTSVTLEAHAPTTPTGHDNDSDTEKKTWSLKRDKKPKDKKDTDRKKKGISLTLFGKKPHDDSQEDEEEKKKDDVVTAVPADEDHEKEVTVTSVTLEAHAPTTPTGHDNDSDTEKKTSSLKRDKEPKDKNKDSDRKKKGISLSFGRKPRAQSETDDEVKPKDDHELEVDDGKEVVVTSVTLETKAPKSPSHLDDSDVEKKTWSLKREKKSKDKPEHKKKGISLHFGRKPRTESEAEDEKTKEEDHKDDPEDENKDDKHVEPDDKDKEVTRTTVTLEAHTPRTPTGDGHDSDTEKKTWSLKRDKKPKDKDTDPHKKKGGIFAFKRRSQAESDNEEDKDHKDNDHDTTVIAEDHKDKEVLRTTVTLEAKAPKSPSHLTDDGNDSDAEKKTWSLKREKPKGKDTDQHKKKGFAFAFGKKHSDSEDEEDKQKEPEHTEEQKQDHGEPEDKITDEDTEKEVLSTAVTLEATAPKSPASVEVKEEDKKTWSLKREKKPKDKKNDDEKPKKKGLSLTFGKKPDVEDKKDKDHEPGLAAANDEHKVIRTEVTLAIEVPVSPSTEDIDADKKTWSLKREKKPKDTPKDKDDKHKKKGVLVGLGKKNDEDVEVKNPEDDEKAEDDTAVITPENENDEGITRTTVTLEASAPKTPSSHDESDPEKKTWSLKRDKKPKDKTKKKGGLFTFGRKSDVESDKEEDEDKKKGEKQDSEVDSGDDKEKTKTLVTLEAKGPSEVEPEKKTWSLKREKKPKDKKKEKGKKKGVLFAAKRKSSSSSSSSSSESDKEDKKEKSKGEIDDKTLEDGDDITKTTVTLEARVPKSDDEDEKHIDPKVELTREDSTRESKREKKKREKEEKEKAKKEKEEERKVKMREGKDKKEKEKDKKKRISGRSSGLCVPSGSTSSLDEEKDEKKKKDKKKEKVEDEDKENKDHVNVVLTSNIGSSPDRTSKTEEERAEERDTVRDRMEGPSFEILQKPRFSTGSVLETPEEGETSVVRKEEVREEEHEEEIEPGVFVKTKRIVKMTTVKTSSYVEVPVSPDGKVLDDRQHEIPVSPIEKLALGPLMSTPTGARVTSRTMEEHEGKDGKEVHRTTTVRTMKFKGKTDDGSVPDIDDFMKKMTGDTGPRKAVLPDKIPNLSRRGRKVAWVAKKLRTLNVLEDAYPNVVTVKQILQEGEFDQCEMAIVCCILEQLQGKGLANELEKGRWIRVQNLESQNGETHVSVEQENDDDQGAGEKVEDIADEEQSEEAAKKVHKVERVKMMPVLSGDEQPTVAVITLLYAEKLAVDAMMDHKTTYVKFKTEGEGQVYTMGMIGQHKVVSTKLARIGHGEGAKISSGNTVTRLLGTFSAVEHVFLVGVAGSVPMLRDDTKHVRLGDVVVAKPEYPGGPIYAYCTGADEDPQGGFSFNSANYNTRDDTIGNMVKSRMEQDNSSNPDWARILDETITFLHARESRFYRPAVETDRVFKMVADHTEECTHPPVTPGSARDLYPTRPVIQYGLVAGGRLLSENESVRRDFALMNDVKGVDFGFHAVMDSIEGNRKDSFMVIRGIADYGDGMSKREWQPYASVAAASYMKALILNLPAPANQ